MKRRMSSTEVFPNRTFSVCATRLAAAAISGVIALWAGST